MINRRSFLKGTIALAATPVLAKLPFESKVVEASPPGLKYALAFPRKDICGNFAVPIVEGKEVRKYIRINTRLRRIYLTARMSSIDFLDYLRDRFDQIDYIDYDSPLVRVSATQYKPYHFLFHFVNGWDFGDYRSCILLMDASWNNFTNIRTIGKIDGEHFGVYYRFNHGKWNKFHFYYCDAINAVNEAIRRLDGPVEFVLVDEKQAIIVSDYHISKLYTANTIVPLYGIEGDDSSTKRFKWNKRMTVYDAKIKLNELWVKDIRS